MMPPVPIGILGLNEKSVNKPGLSGAQIRPAL